MRFTTWNNPLLSFFTEKFEIYFQNVHHANQFVHMTVDWKMLVNVQLQGKELRRNQRLVSTPVMYAIFHTIACFSQNNVGSGIGLLVITSLDYLRIIITIYNITSYNR